ncbi:hypothetical protein [Winogradskyella helgolandensis]|uniref:hypothetical protein n=1 Tax=Winogradskyella helgolandensis TaxID=2697010 RepID=UPI0015C9B36F|nr:hypothetical protein [Winogradskyella helgolandensis]
MKKLLKSIILLLTLSGCAQEKNCAEFKTGKFNYVDEKLPFEIIRNDTLQIERNLKTGVEIHTSVEWKSDCEYILTYKKILNINRDVSDVIGKQIFVNILEIDGNKIKVQAKSDAIDDELEFIKTE